MDAGDRALAAPLGRTQVRSPIERRPGVSAHLDDLDLLVEGSHHDPHGMDQHPLLASGRDDLLRGEMAKLELNGELTGKL